MTTSPERTGFGRTVGRRDAWIMVTGVVMFLLSFAPWEGLSPETLGNLGLGDLGLGTGLNNVPVGAASIYNAWHVGFGGWLPCLVALAIAGAVAAHGFFGVQVMGAAEGRILLRIVSAISTLVLSIRAISLFVQHNPNVGQARWGVYLAFIAGVTQFALVIWGRKKKTARVTASADLSGSPAPERAADFCPRCGTRSVAGDNFCLQCGATVNDATVSHPGNSAARY
jgi:hypothetical protein